MYLDYLADIVEHYRTGQRNASLPQRLIRPTPGSIKDECLSACKTRFHRNDLQTLTAFFAVENDQDKMLRAINRCERDRFRPLVNFLKGSTNTTDDLNIELLAWLINFPYRPFKAEEYRKISPEFSSGFQNNVAYAEMEVERNTEEDLTIDEKETGTDETVGKELDAVKKAEKKTSDAELVVFITTRRKTLFAVIGLLLLALAGFYIMDRKTSFAFGNNAPQKCMMWTGDHYVPVSCEPKHGDTLMVAFDMQRINNFKRITRPDTITLFSEGKLWYIKRNGQIEYYTAGGRHPVEPGRALKPLTKYMILKYHNPFQ